MATSHSLSSPTSPRTVSQLPFSPSNNAPRLPGINTNVSASTSPSPTPASPTRTRWTAHDRTGSVVSSRSRAHTNTSHVAGELPLAPRGSASMPIMQPRPTTGTTHVGGILPSASFFHPSRPNNVPVSATSPPPRPSTVGSLASIGGSTVDAVRLSQLGGSQQRERTSEGSGSPDDSMEDAKAATIAPSLSSNKFSREPLLPISMPPKPPNGAARPTIVTQTSPYDRSESNLSAGARMRGSFEKLFKRPFSFDRTPTTSPSHPGPSSTFNHHHHSRMSGSAQVSPITFELGGGGVDRSPTSPGHRKRSLSPLQGSTASLDHASFIATPPSMSPPLCATPVVDAKTGKPMRRYQLNPSRNRFLLGGRILTGGDSPWAFVGALTLVLTITGVYFGTTCVWWWKHESPAVAAVGAYLCLLTVSSMFATAFRDPGILPRNLDPEPPYPASWSTDGSLRQPLPRDLKVRAGIVRTKFCPTCMTYRPPRSSHCKMCDNCVDGCDHHCQWVNNCIGRRNYTVFFTFLLSGVTTLVLVIITTAVHLFLVAHKYGLGFRHAIGTSEGVGSAIAFSLSIVVFWPVMALFSYHLRLLLLNVTTIEQIRNQAHKTLLPEGPAPPNPFSHGSWRRNLVYMLCRPTGYSWLDARAVATEDKREVNPGLMDDEDWPEDVEDGTGRVKLKGE